MRSWVVVCTLFALLVGCGGAPRPPAVAEYLAEIRIEGTKAIDVEDIAPGLAIDRARIAATPRAVDPYLLSVDTERVRAAYLKLGYFDVKVSARIDLKGKQQTVVFIVVEGKRATVKVEIIGLPTAISQVKARKLVALADGSPFDYEVYELAKQPMVKLLQDAGYANVDIEAAVLADKAQGVATIRFSIYPGDLTTFGAITIDGAGSLEDAVRGRLTFGSGDVFSATTIETTQRELYDLNRFSTVRIDPDRTKGAVVPIHITVVRLKGGEWRAGVGAGRDPLSYEIRGRLGVTIVPQALPLWAFSADFRPAATFANDVDGVQGKYRVVTSARRSEMFHPHVVGELEASFDYLKLEGYLSVGPRFRAGVSSPLGARWLTGRAGWLIEAETFSEIDIADPVAKELGLRETQRRGAYELQLSADLRDNPLDVHKGLYGLLRLIYGTPYALGDGTYTEVAPELRAYYPLGPFVLALRARIALLFGNVPVTERYFAGGFSSFRGYSDRQLSPRAPSTDGGTVRIGGEGLLESGVELRIPLTDHLPFTETEIPIGTSLFVDAADVVDKASNLDLANPHVAVGTALYIKLVGIKIGADVGFRINRLDGEHWYDNYAWHIVVGDSY